MPIAIHGAPSRGLGFDFFDSFVEVHALEHPLPLMIQMTNMIFQGVFELFPQLRVAYLEAGAGWVPFMMDRLDEDFERRGKKWAPRLKKRPSDYITGGQVYVSLESEERTLPYVLEAVRRGSYFFRVRLSPRTPTDAVLARYPGHRSARGYFRYSETKNSRGQRQDVLPAFRLVSFSTRYFAYIFPAIFTARVGRSTGWRPISISMPTGFSARRCRWASASWWFSLSSAKCFTSSAARSFLSDFSLSLMGRYRGGQAKIAIVSSSLFGNISGSAVANVVVDGAFTIPMMKKAGYPAPQAAAIEATASTGGQIMPPVMGAAAFLIAEYLQIPYAQVALAAAVPAVLYYVALFIQVDLLAARNGIHGLPREEVPQSAARAQTLGELCRAAGGADPLDVYSQSPAGRGGFVGRAGGSDRRFCYSRDEDRLAGILRILTNAGRGMLEIVAITGLAGVVIGVLQLTGSRFHADVDACSISAKATRSCCSC